MQVTMSKGSLTNWRATYFRGTGWFAHIGLDTRHNVDGHPKVSLYLRRTGKWQRRLYIPLPHVSWRRGYQLRKVGGLRFHRLSYGFYRWLGPTPSYMKRGG